MIHLISAENRHLYDDVLAEMHAARHEYFVKGRGWTDLASEQGRELDRYDDERTLYLIGFEPDGGIGVSARLLHADRGCVLSDAFPHLVSDGPARGEGVYELSRYFTSPARRGIAGFPLRSRLHVATLEAAVELGARRVVSFTDIYIINLLRYTGWSVRPIGPPCAYEQGTAGAFEIACGPADLARLRQRLQLEGRQLYKAPAWLPRGADVRAIARATDLLLNAPAPVLGPVLQSMEGACSQWSPQGAVDELIARLGERAAA